MEPQQQIQAAYEGEIELIAVRDVVFDTIAQLDAGRLRVAEPVGGTWKVHAWVMQAITLYFRLTEVRTMGVGPFEWYDKIPTKTDLESAGVRVVPPGVVRYGAYCEPGVVVMPGFVNIGAWVGEGSMVDTWATIGSCAHVGRRVHVSGGVGIGGVLEPPGSRPVIIEDGAFIGSRSILVEGVHIGARAVLGANTTLTGSTPIIDVRGGEPIESRGVIPPNAVVVPGSRPKEFPGGTFGMPCALIIGERTESTDEKTSLNDALRTFEVPV